MVDYKLCKPGTSPGVSRLTDLAGQVTGCSCGDEAFTSNDSLYERIKSVMIFWQPHVIVNINGQMIPGDGDADLDGDMDLDAS